MRDRFSVLTTGVLGLGGEIRAVDFRTVLDTWSYRNRVAGGVLISRVERLKESELRADICLDEAREVVAVGHGCT